ncbi:hypothetical protein [Saccharopolyspora mangrovi]|uniref:Uncharacterized protein n=1 Tax=Saccharopolyspora mangrovi TaxID=3082379 RepID=A0ABU6AIP1_9PSEU|nr:hypothetical protein [Saccharopolyspora sp. S2-29]MEB3371376.1 hypothetical protein [Saccharopolyspora sp. S2-29]
MTDRTHDEILRHLLPAGDNAPTRVIKRKMSSWHLKRTRHTNSPPPENQTITIVPATKPATT